MKRHIENIKNVYNLPIIVAINKFYSDTENELNAIQSVTNSMGVDTEIVTSYEHGSCGALELAKKVIKLCENKKDVKFAYNLTDDIKTKIEKIATKIYHAKAVNYSKEAEKMIEVIEKNGYNNLPVVVAKTQSSFSDNKEILNVPENFDITITDLKIRGGAEFIVAIAGNMLLMPGLSAHSAYEKMTIDENGKINGLF